MNNDNYANSVSYLINKLCTTDNQPSSLTQNSLSKLLGVRQAAINNIAAGSVNNPSSDLVKNLAESLNIPASLILGLEKIPEDQIIEYLPKFSKSVQTSWQSGVFEAGTQINVERRACKDSDLLLVRDDSKTDPYIVKYSQLPERSIYLFPIKNNSKPIRYNFDDNPRILGVVRDLYILTESDLAIDAPKSTQYNRKRKFFKIFFTLLDKLDAIASDSNTIDGIVYKDGMIYIRTSEGVHAQEQPLKEYMLSGAWRALTLESKVSILKEAASKLSPSLIIHPTPPD
ncbi:helix-turn-helix transcriptional regulator [Piscirickettsia litoralis]|uniref:HTH cro/C1-type domain-containing protein n=1 Tax=Piscirickettsia litoralis TaxID=1891921 RepID=A0ABX2ZY69_9GAMM|nr:helix-turn-helix domain-containing protein [Piscirickettsia litoralis]ODN41522.1 hypothetical protein BGC07_15555 [Piscirickettsia litoralis]